jgi:DNA-binding MarR family transcriptional regulator
MRSSFDDRLASKDIIEIGLGSIGKIRIIKALAEENKMATVYLLHKKTKLKRDDIKNNLQDLIKIGWVNEDMLANAMYSINRDNADVIKLIEFFRQVGYLE